MAAVGEQLKNMDGAQEDISLGDVLDDRDAAGEMESLPLSEVQHIMVQPNFLGCAEGLREHFDGRWDSLTPHYQAPVALIHSLCYRASKDCKLSTIPIFVCTIYVVIR